jgi:acetyltransferase-like isoleucine patch superfamily enzyme
MTGVMKVSATVFAPGETVGAAELTQAGLLLLGEQVTMDANAVFVPADAEGAARRIEIGSGARVGAYSLIYGGARIGEYARVEEHTIVGKPEKGYAVGRVYPGAGAHTQIGPGVVVRADAVIYAGVQAGAGTVIGHHTLLRSFVTVGEDTQLGHNLTIERAARIGHCVRCSPGSHITSSCVLADRVFLGAGVRTVNDRELVWREAGREPKLVPPRFERGAKVGSGSVILAGVVIGENALVGAGSVVTRDVPAGATAYGVPARVHDRHGSRRRSTSEKATLQ